MEKRLRSHHFMELLRSHHFMKLLRSHHFMELFICRFTRLSSPARSKVTAAASFSKDLAMLSLRHQKIFIDKKLNVTATSTFEAIEPQTSIDTDEKASVPFLRLVVLGPVWNIVIIITD